MSVMEIKFDVEDLIGELDLIQKTQIPFAASQALKVFGFKLAKEVLPQEFQDKLDAPDGTGSPVPRTVNAIKYAVNGMEVVFSVSDKKDKGLSPKQYLYSALFGGQVTRTALSAGIYQETKRYPIPAHGNLRALGQYTSYGDIKPSYASTVLSGLRRKGTNSKGERFVATGASRSGGLQANRVYRIKGNQFIPIMTLVDTQTVVDPAIPYKQFVEKTAERMLPSILSKQLERAMASR